MTDEIRNFVELLEKAHDDNKRLYYYASAGRDEHHKQEIMPVTPFVFELFIYNSIYDIDWSTSLSDGKIIRHADDRKEVDKQKALEGFLKLYCEADVSYVYGAFSELKNADLAGEWTKVQPGIRIDVDKGKQFFNVLRKIQVMLNREKQLDAAFFIWLEQCRYYVYLVRNNIFHGSKRLGETYEPAQKKRLSIYLMFLRGINSLFFSVISKSEPADIQSDASVVDSLACLNQD